MTRAGAQEADPVVQQLVLAADQFLVARPLPDDPDGRSVIAGYHWFNDWGRDTMISLPGLTLATGRAEEAASILRTFARYLADGLLPNNFPDSAGVDPGLQHRRRHALVRPGDPRLPGGDRRRLARHRPPAGAARDRRAPPRRAPATASASIRRTGCFVPASPGCS